MGEQSHRMLFVINKVSGRNKGFDWHEAIQKHFKPTDHHIEYFYLPVEDCLDKFRVCIKNYKPTLIIAVGGDGTVTLVASEAIKTNIPMAIVPAGSANGMARELNIPENASKAFDIVLNGEEKRTDVISINGEHLCLHLSDIGINAQLVKYFQQGNVRGKIGYAFALVKALTRRRKMRVSINSKNSEVERDAVMVLIANASRYGTGATINPEGSIYDGIFEVVIVRKFNVFDILKILLRFQRFSPKKIEFLQATSVRIETSKKMDFQVDGEYLGKVTRVEARVLPSSLRLLVPAES
jgi:diacylglycerol kinase (ATP)